MTDGESSRAVPWAAVIGGAPQNTWRKMWTAVSRSQAGITGNRARQAKAFVCLCEDVSLGKFMEVAVID